jgi:hypothetical protein
MKYPWFCFEFRHGHYLPEDVNFTRKAKAKGFGVSCHTGWHLDHIGRHRYSVEVGIGIAENKHLAEDKWANESLDPQELARLRQTEVV